MQLPLDILKQLDPKTARLLIIFLCYLTEILIYSVICHSIYRKDPICFLFNSEMAHSKNDKIKSELKRLIEFYEMTVTALDEFITAYKNKTFSFQSDSNDIRILAGNFLYHISITSVGETFSLPRLDIFTIGQDEGFICPYTKDYHLPRTPEDAHKIFIKICNYVNKRLNNYKNDLGKIEDKTYRIWNYFDFLYFSTITQTTVGYGDMLPNTTLIRMIISSQIIVGLFLLGILINIFV